MIKILPPKEVRPGEPPISRYASANIYKTKIQQTHSKYVSKRCILLVHPVFKNDFFYRQYINPFVSYRNLNFLKILEEKILKNQTNKKFQIGRKNFKIDRYQQNAMFYIWSISASDRVKVNSLAQAAASVFIQHFLLNLIVGK